MAVGDLQRVVAIAAADGARERHAVRKAGDQPFAVGVVVSNVLGERWLLASLSVWDAGRVIVHGIAGLDTQNEAPVAAAVTLGAAVTLLSIAAVRRNADLHSLPDHCRYAP